MLSRIVSGQSAARAPAMSWTRSPRHAVEDARQPAISEETRNAGIEARERASYQMGFRDGEIAAAQAAAARTAEAVNRAGRMLEEIAGFKSRLRREAEEDVVKLSIAIARRVLYREIQVDPESLHGLVKAALGKVDLRELHRIRLHPEDAGHLRTQLAGIILPSRVEIVTDGSLERGAVLLETSRGNLDGSVETQLREIERGFVDLLQGAR
ncbi:MAG TPA: FliH/SctL family protein [Bryobacteraceae bacterium]|nr:FliH/SctL family protein [Bryobacteraceae bacterium]